MLPKFPHEKTVIKFTIPPRVPHKKTNTRNLGKLEGLQILNLFEEKALHVLTLDEAKELWKFLTPYLWEEEEEKLFVAWEHFRFGRGEYELVEQILNIRERMKRGKYLKEGQRGGINRDNKF